MEGQSLKTHCSAAAGFLPKSGGGGERRRRSSFSSSCWIPPRFLRHPKIRTGGSCWISVVEIRTPPLRSLPALSLQQQQEFVNIVEGNDDDASEEKKKKNIDDDDDEMVRSSGGGRRRRRSSSSSSVHVKFVLHKECSFGEKFLLVGDDPMFGLWDLHKAIPLKWSEGHFWTAEMDLPLEKSSIQFKFILGDASSSGGEFHWQPGPDRVLHIWDTPNTIVVTEDWDKAENQKLTEEEEKDQPPPLLMQQQQLMMITNQDGDGDGDNVQQLLACGLTSINPPPSPPVSAEVEAETEPPIAVFPNDDVVENESQPLDNIMFTSEKANELLECYSSQSRPSS